MVYFDEGYPGGRTDVSSATFAFQRIGDLPAGVETKVTAVFHYVDLHGRWMVYLPLYFSHGAEIRTNHANDTARLFRRGEMLRHGKLIEAYFQENPRSTLRASPYLRFPPIFPGSVDPATIPSGLKVDFTVGADGTVEDATLTDKVQPEILAGVQRAVQGWLYFPKLESGQPVRSRVSMELDFQGPPPNGGGAPAKPPAAP